MLGVPLASGLGIMAGKVDKIPPGSVRTSCCDILWSCTDVYPFDGMLCDLSLDGGFQKQQPCSKICLATRTRRRGGEHPPPEGLKLFREPITKLDE